MRRLFLAAATFAVGACANDAATPTESVTAVSRVASLNERADYIVVFRDDEADPRGKAIGLARQFGGSVAHTYGAALKGFSGSFSGTAIADLARDPSVAYVERDQEMTAFTTQAGATWGIDRIDQRALPLSGTYSYAATGSGVRAYIVDTGIRTSHSEFSGRASVGFDAIGDGRNGIDCNGHGTHVAGTVGGTTYGAAKAVSLVAVRVLNCSGSGTTSGVIAGIDWVTANAIKPAVANVSLGGGASTALDQAVTNSIASGVAYAVAAGNGNQAGIAQDACKYSPARTPTAMTIGATDKTDRKASFSNYGNCVDWFAPGVGITSAWITSDGATNTISGTSMATPHVAGVAALYLQGNPTATAQQVRDALYAATTKGAVTSSKTTNNHLLFTAY